jgi:hypothetical protein
MTKAKSEALSNMIHDESGPLVLLKTFFDYAAESDQLDEKVESFLREKAPICNDAVDHLDNFVSTLKKEPVVATMSEALLAQIDKAYDDIVVMRTFINNIPVSGQWDEEVRSFLLKYAPASVESVDRLSGLMSALRDWNSK